jgi:hypothetical protein
MSEFGTETVSSILFCPSVYVHKGASTFLPEVLGISVDSFVLL